MATRVLVVAPHPDDEVLGVGGTIAKSVAQGHDVSVVIVTRGFPPAFDEDAVDTVRREAGGAHARLGVTNTVFLDFPAAALDTVEHHALNERLSGIFRDLRPDVLYVPFVGDIHADHQLVFQSCLVAARPNGGFAPSAIYAYETLSETNWNAPYLTPGFVPNVFVDISEYVTDKIEAMRIYASQIKPPPHERSAEALMALATLRGATISRAAAEAFVLVREIR